MGGECWAWGEGGEGGVEGIMFFCVSRAVKTNIDTVLSARSRRVLRRERGWTIIAQPFPGLSVAAVTTRAHKIMRTRNTSIETLVMQGFGNE